MGSLSATSLIGWYIRMGTTACPPARPPALPLPPSPATNTSLHWFPLCWNRVLIFHVQRQPTCSLSFALTIDFISLVRFSLTKNYSYLAFCLVWLFIFTLSIYEQCMQCFHATASSTVVWFKGVSFCLSIDSLIISVELIISIYRPIALYLIF